MFEYHEMVYEKHAFTFKQFPDRLSSLSLHFCNVKYLMNGGFVCTRYKICPMNVLEKKKPFNIETIDPNTYNTKHVQVTVYWNGGFNTKHVQKRSIGMAGLTLNIFK